MKLEIKLSEIDLINQIEDLRNQIDSLRPLTTETEDRIFQKFRLDWNYHSNAIEGNTLNYGETYAFLMHGITAKGKPLKDYLDIKGHNNAINFLLNFIHDREELSEAAIRELHKIILSEPYEIDAITQNGKPTKKKVELGAYKKTPNHVKTATGEIHYFSSPEETPSKMDDLIKWYREARENKGIHPVVLAAFLHHKFVSIHPFDDGNGRIARLLMNLILLQNHLPPAIMKMQDRGNYYLALSQADVGTYLPLMEYIAEGVIHSQQIYLKGAKGESIDEPDDLDKEIELINKSIEKNPISIQIKKDKKVIKNFYSKSLKKTLKFLDKDLNKIKNFFIASESFEIFSTKNQLFGKREIRTIKSEFQPDELLYSSLSVRRYVLFVFLYKDFKSSHYPFDLNSYVLFVFNDFDYQVKVRTTDFSNIHLNDILEITFSRPSILKNMYDQTITEEQMISISKEIQRDVIDYIKQKSTVLK